jgi:hypothetical protein
MRVFLRPQFLLCSIVLVLARQASAQDPPTIVGTITAKSGETGFAPSAQEGQLAPATINSTLTNGSVLTTGKAGRMDVGIGATAMRLNGSTKVELCSFDEHLVQIGMDQGDVYVRVRGAPVADTYEIGTPQVSVILKTPGRYRIQVLPDKNTTVLIVREGDADVTGAGAEGPQSVHAPQSTQIVGQDVSHLSMNLKIPADEFEQICDKEDAALAQKPAPPCAPGVTGCE